MMCSTLAAITAQHSCSKVLGVRGTLAFVAGVSCTRVMSVAVLVRLVPRGACTSSAPKTNEGSRVGRNRTDLMMASGNGASGSGDPAAPNTNPNPAVLRASLALSLLVLRWHVLHVIPRPHTLVARACMDRHQWIDGPSSPHAALSAGPTLSHGTCSVAVSCGRPHTPAYHLLHAWQ